MDIKQLWQNMLVHLETTIPALFFDNLMKSTAPINITDNKFVLCADSEMMKNILEKRYITNIRNAMQLESDLLDDVVIITPEEKDLYKREEDVDIKPIGSDFDDFHFIKKYTFDNFVVGKSNEFAVAASNAVAEQPGKKYNPLFIYGGVGLGKTHLVNAIGNHINKQQPKLKTVYISCEKFTNELIEAIRDTKNPNDAKKAFRQKYRNCDVLMIDDIQFISKTDATQEELFHTFNELHLAEKQIIICSDRPPREIQHLEERLRTRFAWGLIADIKPPDLETRVAILQKKAVEQGTPVDTNILKVIAESVTDNIRDMEGLLTRVISYATLTGKKSIDIDIVNEALKDYTDDQKEMISIDTVIDTVCDYFSVDRADLIGKRKNKEIVEPRQICMYLITEFLTTPLKEIGNVFGGRDHTTVIFARDKIAEKLGTNDRINLYIKDLKDMLLKK